MAEEHQEGYSAHSACNECTPHQYALSEEYRDAGVPGYATRYQLYHQHHATSQWNTPIVPSDSTGCCEQPQMMPSVNGFQPAPHHAPQQAAPALPNTNPFMSQGPTDGPSGYVPVRGSHPTGDSRGYETTAPAPRFHGPAGYDPPRHEAPLDDWSAHSAVAQDSHPRLPMAGAAVGSDGLIYLARRYILDPETTVVIVSMRPSMQGPGRRRVLITLETTDSV
ncbi:hypothetical protein BC834DRAFT_387045 [Gloeopeniophorella convolvens]|nr:hypothetical protein BC834DRAFT_387045 [Gloeopeniophorella convolvens]